MGQKMAVCATILYLVDQRFLRTDFMQQNSIVIASLTHNPRIDR